MLQGSKGEFSKEVRSLSTSSRVRHPLHFEGGRVMKLNRIKLYAIVFLVVLLLLMQGCRQKEEQSVFGEQDFELEAEALKLKKQKKKQISKLRSPTTAWPYARLRAQATNLKGMFWSGWIAARCCC
jgi:hypothetical protein